MEEIHCHGGVNKKMSDKILFQCDYNEGAHPKVLERLVQTNMEQTPGYSEDKYCEEAREKIRKACGDDSLAVHFLVGGTQTNVTVINAALRKHQGVLCAVTGHINVHETGAVEACGHKVLGLESPDGKITAAQVAEAYEAHIHNDSFEHMVQPKMVYISNATEYGTVYTLDELKNIRTVCDELGLYLMMDGARLGVALSTVDYTLNDLANICDVFYIGGTKNGALMGEAVVISNPELKPYFRFVMKQNGAMLAKGWLLGIQFLGLFEHDAFFGYAKQSVVLAQKIQSKLQELGYALFMKSDTNQIFVNVSKEQYQFLSENIDFEIWEKCDDHYVIRFVTSWHTSEDEVNALITYLEQAIEKKE